MENNIQKGQLKRWDDEKGFGFIRSDGNTNDIFIHISALKGNSRRPKVGDTIFYNINLEHDGKERAFNARIDGTTKAQSAIQSRRYKRHGKGKVSPIVFLSFLFIVVVCISTLLGSIPFLVLPYYLLVSVLTFFWYWGDKSAAQSGGWRTPESTLQMFSLIGGWPGGLIAQQVLRHKSKKQSFKSVFWGTVVLNCGVLAWFHTAEGGRVLHQLLESIEMVLN